MANEKSKTNKNDETNEKNVVSMLTIEQINKNEQLRQKYVDSLLKQLSDEKTSKNDKKTIRRFLRSLNHRNGLRGTKYQKSKSINDFVSID
jgi:predicted ABC-type exoprotein transport system permease subunit